MVNTQTCWRMLMSALEAHSVWENRKLMMLHLREEIEHPFILSLEIESVASVIILGPYKVQDVLVEFIDDKYTVINGLGRGEYISTIPMTPEMWLIYLNEKNIGNIEIIQAQTS